MSTSCSRANIRRVLTRFGGDLLSHALRRSTIGATVLNGRVRDGIGCFTCAITTKPGKNLPVPKLSAHLHETVFSYACLRLNMLQKPFHRFWIEPHNNTKCVGVLQMTCASLAVTGSNQAYRAISTGQLNALLHLHLRPIDVVVYHGPQGRPCFEGGFPLRCLQRLSCPNVATQHCRWHDNWSTSGSFTPVLSY
jgi:hypothetical protein